MKKKMRSVIKLAIQGDIRWYSHYGIILILVRAPFTNSKTDDILASDLGVVQSEKKRRLPGVRKFTRELENFSIFLYTRRSVRCTASKTDVLNW